MGKINWQTKNKNLYAWILLCFYLKLLPQIFVIKWQMLQILLWVEIEKILKLLLKSIEVAIKIYKVNFA